MTAPYPIGTFTMDGGAIVALSENARMIAHGGHATLTGVGTYDILVTYESDPIYGGSGNQTVAITFERGVLTDGGAYDVQQTTPEDFDGGVAAGLLDSSVFEMSFDGAFSTGFEIAIPYDESEVAAVGVSEEALFAIHEVDGPLAVIEVDTDSNIVRASAFSAGKYGIATLAANAPPVANAGPDQTAYAGPDGVVTVALDGSASEDADSDPLMYTWLWVIGDEVCTDFGPNYFFREIPCK